MGYFNKTIFYNYRNLDNFNINFEKELNIIIGKNGSGKTNILEGISLFEKGRGFRKEKILNLINYQNQNQNFRVDSTFVYNDISMDISVFSSDIKLKKISINNKVDYDSKRYFESLFSIIYFLPEMERIFLSTPSLRRNFIDRLIFTSDKEYSSIVNHYKKFVNERQVLLKESTYDENWIEEIEKNIARFGNIIYKKRTSHINSINKILQKINNKEHFSSNFIIKIQDEFLNENIKLIDNTDLYFNKIKNNRKLDSYSGRCLLGPHRSDIVGLNTENNFNLNQLSTGQQKTIVLLIIISQSMYLMENFNIKPIILLDEVCSHLDNINRDVILYLINELKVQVFMTGTEKKFFSFLSTKANYCNIN